MGSVEAGCEGSWLPHPEEQLFLDQLFTFMDRQGSPIHKVPNLGFKKSESLIFSFLLFPASFFMSLLVFWFFLPASFSPLFLRSFIPPLLLHLCPHFFILLLYLSSFLFFLLLFFSSCPAICLSFLLSFFHA